MKVFCRYPVQKGDRSKHVPVSLNLNVCSRERLLKQPPPRQGAERPVPLCPLLVLLDLLDMTETRQGRQQDSPKLQHAAERLKR